MTICTNHENKVVEIEHSVEFKYPNHMVTHDSTVLERNVNFSFLSKDSEDFVAVRRLRFLRNGVLRAEWLLSLSLVSLYLITLSSSLFCCQR